MYASSSSVKPKRQLVKAACNSCQKRKVKCSGERPSCALCQSRGQICTYDSEAGVTRVEALRRRNKELAEQNADYEIVYQTLQTAPEAEAVNHLYRLREHPDVESFAGTLKRDLSTSSSRKRRTDGLEDSADERATSQPLSTHSQDGVDGEDTSVTDSLFAGAEERRPNPAESSLVDPQLRRQQRIIPQVRPLPFGAPYTPDAAIQPNEVWSFQDPMLEDAVFPPAWDNAQPQAGATQGYGLQDYPYNQQFFSTEWTGTDIDPLTGRPRNEENAPRQGRSRRG